MPSPTALTLYAFGVSAFIAGVSTLVDPQSNAKFLMLPTAALPAVRGNGLAAIAMGIYYTLAAYQENKAFALATVPMRCTTASVFFATGGNWHVAAWWEGGSAAITALALLWERSRSHAKTKTA
jgi:hypothetical protein